MLFLQIYKKGVLFFVETMNYSGYVLYEKRPSQGRFRKPVFDSNTGRYKISYADLVCLTEGLTRTEIRLPEASSEDCFSELYL